MDGLASPDAARQADVFYEVEREYTRAPTTASTLRYAVARVTPGHPAASPSEGKRLLEALLATPERMTPEERTLAAVLLHETNTRLKLEAENRRLLATLDGRSRSQANSDKRTQAQLDENARLRRALAEAQQKLDAIKEIERTIIERSPRPLAVVMPPTQVKRKARLLVVDDDPGLLRLLTIRLRAENYDVEAVESAAAALAASAAFGPTW